MAAGAGRDDGSDDPGDGCAGRGQLQAHLRSVGAAARQHADLLLSGCTVTWAHHALLQNKRGQLIAGLVATVLLGATFTVLQYIEYGHAAFTFAGHSYGSDVFMATGFPRRARDHRHDLPARVPAARDEGPLHAEAALRVRGGGLVLAFSSTWTGCSCSPASTCGARVNFCTPAGTDAASEMIDT